MRITMLKSKIHRATVTDANLNYEGSVSIDPRLCEAAHLIPFERVEIYNCNNGERFATYVIYGKEGEICLNGAAARMVHKGDLVIIAAYADFEQEEAFSHKPQLVMVNGKNEIKKIHNEYGGDV
ncbi:MAG: aspartate 1-decarboxylase [Calothrix sp. SM1_5_4]|nr:aspartate 1-decarboxylase [Calothrix sp. SM1_5_4]